MAKSAEEAAKSVKDAGKMEKKRGQGPPLAGSRPHMGMTYRGWITSLDPAAPATWPITHDP